MKLVIELPEGMKKSFDEENQWSALLCADMRDILRKGKPYDERTKGEWIPVSERLPEEEGDYLLWGKIDESEEDEYSFIGSYDEGCEQFGIWQEQFDSRTLGSLGSEFHSYSKVVAWQELPRPYKEKEE